MHLAGLADKLGDVRKVMDQVGNALGLHMPFEAVISSDAMGGSATSVVSNVLADTSDNNVSAMGCHSDHKPVSQKFGNTNKMTALDFNNVYKDTYDRDNSNYYKIYKKLGPCYMGCNVALRQEAGQYKCKYEDGRNTNSTCK
jgi:hypothetical protein